MEDDVNADEYVCQDCQTVGLPGACHVCGGTMVLLPKTETVEADGRDENDLDDDLLTMHETPEPQAPSVDDDL